MNTRPLLGALVAALVVTTSALAGWFGPSTYDECILDEMKGRPAYMMETVKRDCTAKFCWNEPLTYTEDQKAALTASVAAAKKASDECMSKAAALWGYDRTSAELGCLSVPVPYLPDSRLVCK
jgi:hypothetical protein